MSYESDYGSTRTITAFFDERDDAHEAVEALVVAGIPRTSVRLVEGGSSNVSHSTAVEEQGFWASLKDFFLPEEDRYAYAEGLRRGGYLVTVTTSEAYYDTALDILDREGTIDIGERESAWRSEGWTGYTGAAATGSAPSVSSRSSASTGTFGVDRTLRDNGDEVIPVAEEELRIGKRDVNHGRVRVRSYVVETPVSEQVNLRQENVSVERRPVDRALTGADDLFVDRTIEVEQHGEEAIVSKEARVREELVVRKDVVNQTETVSDTLRRTEVEVEDDRDALTRRTTTTR